MDEQAKDPYSGLVIRPTENGPKESDIETPQPARLLNQAEIDALIAKGVARNGNS